MRSRRRIAALVATVSIVFAACSGGTPASNAPSIGAVPSNAAGSVAPPSAGGAPVTVEWWHITTGEPGKADFQAIADAYTKAHPNVKINITVLENEAFKTKLATSIQSGQIPDLFHSWGGGIMAAQADAGALKDITSDIASWKDTINAGALSIYAYKGIQYGVPWDMGLIGVWYNKKLFAKAGITAPPATWEDFLADAARDRRQGQVAVHAPVDLSGPAGGWRRGSRPDGPERQLEHRRLHEGR